MTGAPLFAALRDTIRQTLPPPGHGKTPARHAALMRAGRQDLSLGRLAEAHWDALAILAEAGRQPEPGAVYGVWASEKPDEPLRLDEVVGRLIVSGRKMFCSGAGIIDRALVTVRVPEERLIDIDLRRNAAALEFDFSHWKTDAFVQTKTAAVEFRSVRILPEDLIGDSGWYLARPGFWHGACGPAACWAGGAAGLVDYALRQSRDDPHCLAHLGAMQAAVWAMRAYLQSAGNEIDADPGDYLEARKRALTVRHLIEQACSDILRRLPRAYGPYPLAMDEEIALRYKELNLYLRQSHAERDLESLGRDVKSSRAQ